MIKNDRTAVDSSGNYCTPLNEQVTHNGCPVRYDELSGSHDPAEVIEGDLLESIHANAVTISEDEDCFMSLERSCHQSLRIIMDSGASGHMLPCRCLFVRDSMRTVQGKVSLGKSDYKLPITGQGKTQLEVLDNVLLVPDLSFGLLSLSKFDVKGYHTIISEGKVTVFDGKKRPVVSGTLEGSLYYLDNEYLELLYSGCDHYSQSSQLCILSDVSSPMDEDVIEVHSQGVLAALTEEERRELSGSAPKKLLSTTVGMNPIDLLHVRLGHLGEGNIKKALKNNMLLGAKYTYEDIKDAKLKFCPVCMEGRMKAFSPPVKFRTKTFDLFEKIAMDYKGKFATASVGNYTGFYLVSDYGSNNVFAYPVSSKDEIATLDVLEKFNSVVGQSGKEMKEVVKIFQSDSDSVLLGGAVSNWFQTNNIKMQTSAPYVHWQNGFIEANIGKVMNKARTMMADGRVPKKFWAHAIVCACYLINRSPFGDSDKTPYEIRFGEKPDISHLVPFYSVGVYHKTKDERKGPWDLRAQRCRMLGYDERAKNSYFVLDLKSNSILTRHDCIFDESVISSATVDSEDIAQLENESSDVFTEIYEESDSEEDTVDDDAYDEEFPYWKPNKFTDAANNVHLERWIDDVRVLICALTVKDLPKLPVVTSIQGALNGPDGDKWREAIAKEVKAFHDHNTFGPADQVGRAMRTKLILKATFDNDYKIKYKARLVACGYSQIFGLDYDETYAPTISTLVIFVVIQIGMMYGMLFSSFDVTAAFLEGKNDYQNFARLPKEFGELGGLRVEVIGNFYGEKQGPKIWNDLMNNILTSFGFERCPVQPCLYLYHDDNGFIIVIVHVDDGLMVFNCQSYRDKFMSYFESRVKKVSMTVEVKRYVGMDFEFSPETRKVKLSHHLYITQNYGEYKGKFGTPMASTTNLRKATPNPNNAPILNETGKIRFICDRGRPDLLVLCGEAASGGEKDPSDEHLAAIERAKHYMIKTVDIGVSLGGLGKVCIFGYSDAAYITDGNCKSRLGGCVFMNADSGAVRSFSKTDTQISSLSHSSCEAEIKAMDEWLREVIHLMDIYKFLCGPYDEPVKLFVDNLSAIELCESLKQNHKVKHINLRIHFIRELIESGFVELHFVPTDYNVADVLTKPLAEEKFERFRYILMNGHGGVFPVSFPGVEFVHCAITSENIMDY
jgi:hypothetical protein